MTQSNHLIEDPSTRAWLESLTDRGQRLVVVRDRARRTTYVSDNAAELTGWSGEEFARRFYSLSHPDDQQLLFDSSRALRAGTDTERLFSARFEAADGWFNEFDIHLWTQVQDPPIDGVVCVFTPLRRTTDRANRWASVLATTEELVLIQRRDLRTGYVSPSVEHLLGIPADELVRSWRDIVDPGDQERYDETRRRVATEAGSEDRIRIRMTHADGSLRVFDTTFANRFDDGIIDGLLIRARDITDLVQMQDELDRAAARFEAMVTDGPDASVLLDKDGRIRFASAGVEALLGYRPDDLVGHNATDLVHPDELDEATHRLVRLLDGSDNPDQALRLRRSDGAYQWIEIHASNRLDDPRIEALILTLRDVTERVDAERRMQRLLRDSSGGAFVIDGAAAVTWTTPGIERFIGPHRTLDPDTVHALFSAHSAEDDAVAAFDRVISDGPGATARVVGQLAPHGTKRWADVTLTNAVDDPAIGGIIVNIRDVDEAVRAGETGHRLTEVLESTTDFVCVFNGDYDLIWANAAAVDVVGQAPMPSDTFFERVPEWATAILEREVVPILEREGSWRGELALLAASDGREIPIEVTILTHQGADGVNFTSSISRDISERKALEAKLHAKARHDPLTGLPNRALLTERLERSLAADASLAVVFLDLDQFKVINDTQGHDAGDRLLIAAVERLRGAVRPADLVARFGGDEFVVLLHGVDDIEQAGAMAKRLVDHLRGPVRLGPVEVYLTASAGVAVTDGIDAGTLISNADAAMYKAKALGRDQVAVFSAELRARTVERMKTANDLRATLETDGLDVWFQPIIDTATGLPISLEALARWEHPELGMVPAQHFIQVAEDTGLIVPLGASVIHRTCASIRELGDAATPYSFSVNISPHQLANPNLIEVFESALETHDIASRQLYCEVTESAVMGDVANSARMLDRIRALGIGIAIDDFGTGYSSLAYLHRFPVDVLKIDREFVSGLTYDSNWERSLAAGIISLAHSLGLTVVAEGVETAEQSDILGMLGCDAQQGFLFARPTRLADLAVTLAAMTPHEDRRLRTS